MNTRIAPTLALVVVGIVSLAFATSFSQLGWAASPWTRSPPRWDPLSFDGWPAWMAPRSQGGGAEVSLKLLVANRPETSGDRERDKWEYGGTVLVTLPTDRWLQSSSRDSSEDGWEAAAAGPSNPSPLPIEAVSRGSSGATAQRTGAPVAERRGGELGRAGRAGGPRRPQDSLPQAVERPGAQGEPATREEDTQPVASMDDVPRIRPQDVRAAVKAASQVGVADFERLDDLDNRARWSAALPDIRLRITRLVDESESLSPTSYDAQRTVASGGESLWLEARTTWRLDRAVFADQEVPIQRLRQQLARQRARRRRELVQMLFAWQAAMFDLADPAADPDRCRGAWLTEQHLAAELDLATKGWFERWRNKSPRRRPAGRCWGPSRQRAADDE